MPQELTLAALDVALGWRDPGAGLPYHSDRGSQTLHGRKEKDRSRCCRTSGSAICASGKPPPNCRTVRRSESSWRQNCRRPRAATPRTCWTNLRRACMPPMSTVSWHSCSNWSMRATLSLWPHTTRGSSPRSTGSSTWDPAAAIGWQGAGHRHASRHCPQQRRPDGKAPLHRELRSNGANPGTGSEASADWRALCDAVIAALPIDADRP